MSGKITYIRWWLTKDGYVSIVADTPEKLRWIDSQIIAIDSDEWIIGE